ncbi:MAG: hypothetical protein WCP20_17620 [Desulfuromonadales bacterium]
MTIHRTACALLLLLFLLVSAIAKSSAAETPMTLADCIATALRENRTIKNAYLDRIVQKYDLRIARQVHSQAAALPLGAGQWWQRYYRDHCHS